MNKCEYCPDGNLGQAIMAARNCLNEKLELSIHLHASKRDFVLAGFKWNDCDASIEELATINYCPMCGRKL